MIFLAAAWPEILAGLLAGVLMGIGLLLWRESRWKSAQAQTESRLRDGLQRELDQARKETRLEAEEEGLQRRKALEQSLAAEGQRLADREALVNRRLEALTTQESAARELQQQARAEKTEVESQRKHLKEIEARRLEELERIAQMTREEARTAFLQQVEQESAGDAARLTRQTLEDAKCNAEEKARRIVSLAIQRFAGEHTYETTTATVTLPGDEIKGRIIGRDGRNIRAFESATGVTVLIDDTPGAVVLSGFDPVRREIARQAMERLIADGRIHPTRIEEVVARVETETDETILNFGQDAVFRSGVAQLPHEVLQVLGRLKFRLSFSQNVLDHSVEVAHLTGLMAAELGMDVASAKRAGLLHDIGKAINHESEGSHALVGAEFLKRHGESPAVVNGVASHHDEVQHDTPIGILVSAADAISASRPGARSETMSTYIQRMENLEKIALDLEGVDKCYAVQAGRELRVMVLPEKVGDEEAQALAKKIARKVEDTLQYPGQIRVTVIRETRVIELAK